MDAFPNSVFHYYKKLIALRRNSQWSDTIVYGAYDLLDPEHEAVYAYTRTGESSKLLIVCNLSDKEVDFTVPAEVQWTAAEQIIGSCAPAAAAREMKLAPWAAAVWAI